MPHIVTYTARHYLLADIAAHCMALGSHVCSVRPEDSGLKIFCSVPMQETVCTMYRTVQSASISYGQLPVISQNYTHDLACLCLLNVTELVNPEEVEFRWRCNQTEQENRYGAPFFLAKRNHFVSHHTTRCSSKAGIGL
jgi:hypothetical protein